MRNTDLLPPNFSDCLAVQMTENGLWYGSDICLASIGNAADSLSMPNLGRDGGRALALMSLAAGRSMPMRTLEHLEAAIGYWKRGDKALANLRLVFAGLPRLVDNVTFERIRLAAYLLDEGIAPADLMSELGLAAAAVDLKKYDENQPRVPAGSGATAAVGPMAVTESKAATTRARVASHS